MKPAASRRVAEFASLRDGFEKSPRQPFVVRHAEEFLHVSFEEAFARFSISNEKVFGYDDAGSHVEGLLLSTLAKQWLSDDLEVLVIDSPMQIVELPPVMDECATRRSVTASPEADSFADRVYAVKHGQSPVLSRTDAYTSFHVDPPGFGGGWMYLWRGSKTWQFLSQQWITTLIDRESGEVRDLSLAELANLDSGIECSSVEAGAGDFVYFPPGWIHRVWTHEKSLGIGGYIELDGARPELQNAAAQLDASGGDLVG